MAAGSPIWARKLWATQDRFPIDASEPWGRLERVAEGIWALVSTPLQDRTTVVNFKFLQNLFRSLGLLAQSEIKKSLVQNRAVAVDCAEN